MSIYLDHDGRTVGPFTVAEINAKLAQGELTAATMAWFTGSADWVPLSQIPGVVVHGSPVPAPSRPSRTNPVQGPGPDTRADAGDPADLFYENVADAFCRAATHLVKPFNDLGSRTHQPHKLDLSTFLNAFLEHATRFNDECPLAFATALRHSTLVDSVRGTTTKQLAAEIRGEAFDQLDEVLRHYHATLTGLNEELRQTTRRINRLRGPEDAYDLIDLQARGDIAIIRMGKVPVQHVKAYLDALRVLPVPLIDYVSAKCFGGTVDLHRQSACVQVCAEHCDQLASKSLRTLDSLLRQREEEARKPQPTPQLPRVNFHFGCAGGFCVITAVIGMIVLFSTLLSNPARSHDGTDAAEAAQLAREAEENREEGIWWGVVLMGFGVGAPLYGVWKTNKVNRARGY